MGGQQTQGPDLITLQETLLNQQDMDPRRRPESMRWLDAARRSGTMPLEPLPENRMVVSSGPYVPESDRPEDPGMIQAIPPPAVIERMRQLLTTGQ